MTDRSAYFKARRDAERGGPPRALQPCGTWAAVVRHYRNGEPLDEACRTARAEHNAEQYRKRIPQKSRDPAGTSSDAE